MAEVEATKVETEKVVDPTPPAPEAPAPVKEAEPVVETPKEVADEKAIVAPALPPPEQVKEKSDDSKALVVVEDKAAEPAEEKKKGSIDRDAVLARVATEKRLSLIKAWEESEKSKAENNQFLRMAKQSDENEKERVVLMDGVLEGMPLFAKELIAGGLAGGFAKTAVAPLELIKILFQTRQAEFRSLGLSGSFTKIAKTEGALGFFRGNGASVVRIVPYAALHFMAYEEYRRWIIQSIPGVGRGPVLDLVAGSFAGGTAVLFTYPLDLVRTKLAYQVVGSQKLNVQGLATSEQFYKGIWDCFSKTYKEAGIRGLYRGVAPSLYGIFPYAGLKFYFYEKMKSHVPQERRKFITVKLACGSVAGLLGQTFTYPLDVVRRQMQVQRLSASNSSHEMKGTLDTLVMIVQRHGWKQLFSGLSLNYLKVVPSVAIGFTVYDLMKSYLRVPSRDEAVVEVVTSRRNSKPSSLQS